VRVFLTISFIVRVEVYLRVIKSLSLVNPINSASLALLFF
jgi:hypothetical protein